MGSGSIASMQDAFKIMDRALTSEKGLVIEFESPAAATKMQQRLYSARVRDRRERSRIYPPDHPEHGRSPYDSLVFIKRGNKITTGRGGLSGLISRVVDLDTGDTIPEEEL